MIPPIDAPMHVGRLDAGGVEHLDGVERHALEVVGARWACRTGRRRGCRR